MRVCYGVDGLPRCSPSLPFIDRRTYADLRPTPEDWAFLIANRKLYFSAAARVFTWRMRHFSKADLLNAMAPSILVSLRDWTPTLSTKKAWSYKAARYHCLAMLGDMYPFRNTSRRFLSTPPVCLDTFDLRERHPAEPCTAKDEEVSTLLLQLSPREREMLIARFGLADEAPLPLARIGQIHMLTTERVRQIVNTALIKLRRRIYLRRANVILGRCRTEEEKQKVRKLCETSNWKKLQEDYQE